MTRRILITGASRGIVRSCALWLARTEAAHLILLGRDAQALAASAEAVRQAGGTAEIHVADVAHRSVLTALTGSVGPLDGLVAAANAEDERTRMVALLNATGQVDAANDVLGGDDDLAEIMSLLMTMTTGI